MLIFFDGFETYSSAPNFGQVWSYGTPGPNFTTNGGFKGTQGIRLAPDNFYGINAARMQYSFDPIRTAAFGIALNVGNPIFDTNYDSSTTTLFRFGYGTESNVDIKIRFSPGGQYFYFEMRRVAGGALIATSNPVSNFTPFAWNYYEVEVDASSTVGYARFYVNGNKIIDVSNSNFSSNVNSTQLVNNVTMWPLWFSDSSENSAISTFDDFYLTDSTRVGQLHIDPIRPSADTVQKDWVPSTGTTNFNRVNSSTYSTSSYVSTTVQDALDYYDLSDFPVDTLNNNVLGVKVSSYADKASFGDTRYSMLLKNGSTTITLPEITPYENQPLISSSFAGQGQNWTVSDINNFQVGITSHINQNVVGQLVNGQFVSSAPGSTLRTGDIAPAVVGDALIFTGVEQLRYTDSSAWHVTAPYSVEFEFYSNVLNDDMMLINIGQGNGIGYPEYMIWVNGSNGVEAQTASTNSSSTLQVYNLIPNGTLQTNRWYRIGIMVYNDGALRHRGYVNGIQTFDTTLTQPWNSPNGIAISGDNNAYPSVMIKGGMRNLRIAQSLFWKI